MKEALNSDTLFNTIAMVRQSVPSLLLVLEGDDDHFILKPHASSDLYLLLGSGGKGAVLAAAELAQQRGLTGVRFLVDSDYDRFLIAGPNYPTNVIASTTHDLIMDLALGSPSTLERVVEVHARAANRSGADVEALAVVKVALALAASLAPLRVANQNGGLGLNLRNFPFGEVPTNATLETLAAIAVGRSSTPLTVGEVSARARAETATSAADAESTVGDHDFFRALARVLKSYGIVAAAAEIFNTFLVAVTCAAIMRIEVHTVISSWSSANGKVAFHCPYPV